MPKTFYYLMAYRNGDRLYRTVRRLSVYCKGRPPHLLRPVWVAAFQSSCGSSIPWKTISFRKVPRPFFSTYGLHSLHNKLATFSQFFFDAQKIKQEPLGTTSITRPPSISGSIFKRESEYYEPRELLEVYEKKEYLTLYCTLRGSTSKSSSSVWFQFTLEISFPHFTYSTSSIGRKFLV